MKTTAQQIKIGDGDDGDFLTPYKPVPELDAWLQAQKDRMSEESKRRHAEFEKALSKTPKGLRLCHRCGVELGRESFGAEVLSTALGDRLWCRTHARVRRRELGMPGAGA